MAPTLLLETKLYVPKAPVGLVPRLRLSDRLDRGAEAALMLVSAPAGFGKTTLLAQWLASGPPDGRRRIAWVSLDRGDNQPGLFWSYVIAALQTVAPGVGENALGLLRATQPGPIETVLTTLLNDVNALTDDVVLVLDDYHLVEAPAVQQGMVFLLDHVPPRLHLVIAGRADPSLPLARLRGRGALVEIRAADLRFTPDEAVAYLNEVMGLELTAEDVTALEGRTEGWIAALQLAALSLRGREDVAGFIADFAGDARYVVDYLVEEVLQRQPERVQSFLLETSVLDRLSGPLCDAVTGKSGGKAMLEALDRGNLFVVPLDDRRRWYRYHQLFADVLRARLADEQPDRVPALHRRASDWYEQNGERPLAIDHALAGEDFERAADLVELAMPVMRRDRREATARGWFERLPEDLFRDRPVLSINYVGILLSTGDPDGVEPRLRDAERWLNAAGDGLVGPEDPSTGMIVLDQEEIRRLPSWVAIYRAAQALLSGDPAAAVTYAQRGIDLFVEPDNLGLGAAAALIGIASWGSGDLEQAEAGYVESMAALRRAGHVSDVMGCAIALTDILIVQGRLSDAMATYEESVRLAREQAGPVLRGTADMYVGMALLDCERGDLAAATQLLQRSLELGEHLGMPQNPYRRRVAMARVREVEGDLDTAMDLLEDAERVYIGDFSPNVRPIPAMRARVRIKQGRLVEALAWVRDSRLSAADDLSYLREFEHVTLGRVLLAQHASQPTAGFGEQALGLLDRLLQSADDGGRTRTVIELLVLQARARQESGESAAALVPLERALALAEPEGHVRVFVDEGAPMAALLEAAVRRGIAPGYTRQLLASFDTKESLPTGSGGLVEPLSERERDVLRLLATDLGGPEIARELVVSLNTVRTHTKNIYTKLDVNNRRAAVTRGEELGLLSRASGRRPEAAVDGT